MTVKQAREYLRAAIDRACVARGEAQWMNGYRCGYGSRGFDEHKDAELHAREMTRFKVCGLTENAVERWIATLVRVVRQSRRTAPAKRASRKRLVKARKP